ncbi:hypothetical protein KAZ92_00560 [Candidatus Gracilibacteria bacterium]|nr:hypothetical protein [Candidatus Gracilibacteria bacterium]
MLFPGSDFDLRGILAPDDVDSQSPVRTEYLRIVPHVLDLARDFDVELSAESQLNVSLLMRSMEVIDRYFDDIQDASQAEVFLKNVLLVLTSVPGVRALQSTNLPQEVLNSLVVLREALLRQGTLPDFLKTVQEVCLLSRKMRTMKDTRQYINAALHEGELAADLLLLSIDLDEPSKKFSDYLRFAVGTGTLVDHLFDFEDDYRNHQTVLPPNITNRSFMMATLVKRAIYLFSLHPNKNRALGYLSMSGRYSESSV